MKDEFSNLYKEIVTEEKQEEFPLTFNDFLESTNEPAPTKKTVKRIPTIFYKVAAVFVLLLSLGLWMINNNNKQDEQVKQFVSTTIKQKKNLAIHIPALPIKKVTADKEIIKKESLDLKVKKRIHETEPIKNMLVTSTSIEETEYIIINGKAIYDKEEALEATENALSLVVNHLNQTKNSTRKLEKILNQL